jgi:lysylphosphatidylglycerol synthetase-like protein (DUF2156 family)
MSNAIIGALFVLVASNAAVTLLIVRTQVLTVKQKLAQSTLVWLVPIVGAALMAAFILSHRERPHSISQHVPNEDDEAFRIGDGTHHS